MKKSDVPQKENSMLHGHRRACYAVDDDGKYTMVPSKGWDVEDIVNGQAVEAMESHIESVRQQALAGEVSPLAYHMARCHMDVGLLAANAGFWRWQVRRHLTTAGFNKLDDNKLARYAQVLGRDVEHLKTIPEPEPAK